MRLATQEKTIMSGIHHVTAIAGNALQNFSFYTRTLGLRFVKKTVNFDDPGTYHFYYGDEVGLTGAGDPDNRRMLPRDDQLDTAQKSVREYFSRISALRSSHPALRYGNRRLLVADETRYAFVRRQFDDRVLAVWNKGTAEAVFDLPAGSELSDGKYADVLTGKKILVESGRTKFSLGPMESAFFIPEIDNSAGKK